MATCVSKKCQSANFVKCPTDSFRVSLRGRKKGTIWCPFSFEANDLLAQANHISGILPEHIWLAKLFPAP